MGFKGQMGVSGNIERPRTAKHKADARARRMSERDKYEYYDQYKCPTCGFKTETLTNNGLCSNCLIKDSKAVKMEKMKTKGKRQKTPAPKLKQTNKRKRKKKRV